MGREGVIPKVTENSNFAKKRIHNGKTKQNKTKQNKTKENKGK